MKMNKLKNSVLTRIWFYTLGIALAAFLLIEAGSQFFFRRYYMSSMLRSYQTGTENTASVLNEYVNSMVRRIVNICGTRDFKELLLKIRNADKTQYTELNNDLQPDLLDLSQAGPLVSSALITGKQNFSYHLLSESLSASGKNYTLGYSPDEIEGITILPIRESPIYSAGNVIPIAVPLGFAGGTAIPTITSAPEDADAVLYLLLDAQKLNNELSLFAGSSSDTISLLVNRRGCVLNYPPGSSACTLVSPSVLSAVTASGGQTQRIQRNRYAFSSQLGKRNFYLISLVPRDAVLEPLYTINSSLLLAAGTAVFLMLIATLLSAFYLSRPLRRLSLSVRAIENGTYDKSMVLHQTDEIGNLSIAIDEMYHIIQNQIQEITDERQAKYNAEIRLFTEQINPHFLYNTLEYINFEVYNHHNENAALMIQSLGDFMRIGLSFGREEVTVEKELEHVQAYITIMNHRFSHDISFTTDVPDELLSHPVLKIILQPLVENSIRHGFLLEDNSSFLNVPSIRIRVCAADGFLNLAVSDNGTGFDPEQAGAIMHSPVSGQNHVGLNNVYQRLKVFYGEKADITLQSIPYYKNTVTIKIPVTITPAADPAPDSF